jgi:hypothetical protein
MHHTLHAGAAADLVLQLSGPKGTARLHVKGERRGEGQGRTWTFSVLDLQPDNRPGTLNLLKP